MVWFLPLLAFAGGGTAATAGGVTTGSVLFYGSAVAAGTAGGIGISYYRNRQAERQAAEERARTAAQSCASGNCDNRRWRVVVQAQGEDCGGTSRSTAPGAGSRVEGRPITKAEGIACAGQTMSALSRAQREIRETPHARLVAFIQRTPFLGEKSFDCADRRGGKRLDLGSFGPSENFVA